MNLTGLPEQARQAISEFIKARDTRERTMLALAALFGIFGFTYALLIDPALVGRKQLNQDIPLQREQVAQMQVLAKETAALSEKSTVTTIKMSKENIETELARKGMKPQSVMLTGEYAKVQLVSVSFAGTLNWLDDMQRNALISVVDANIVALAQPDRVNATFTLRQARNE